MANLDASQFVKSKYLKGADLDRRKPIRVTIEGVDQKEFPEQGQKLVLSFLEIDQDLVLNKTQTRSLIDLFGPATAVWRGQRINLRQVSSSYQNLPTVEITEGETVAPSVRAAAPDTDSAEVLFAKEMEF